MSLAASKPFNNVMLRVREGRCIVSSVAPPFRTAYWPEFTAIAAELGLNGIDTASLEKPEVQERFVSNLADHVREGKVFRPAMLNFKLRPEEIRRREEFRRSHCWVTFLGVRSREVILGTLELLTQRLRPNGAVEVRFKQWDPWSEWSVGQQRICDVCNYLYQTKQCRGSLTLFSSLREVDKGLWDFLYDRPRVRVGWVAAELAGCGERNQFEQYRQESSAFKNLQEISNAGVWPHIILPVCETNTKLLPEMVLVLIEASRGGTIEIVPVPLLPREREAPAPELGSSRRESALTLKSDIGHRTSEIEVSLLTPAATVQMNEELSVPRVDEYVQALLAIYRNPWIPLHLVAPLSWVAARINSEAPLISSPVGAAADVAVLSNGDMYASEWSVGLGHWHLGNVLDGSRNIHWERLDAMAETFSNCMKPDECKTCDWRYRCGGLDASVMLREEQHRSSAIANAGNQENDSDGANHQCSLFQLYCAPRKTLFEEALWGSVDAAAQGQLKRAREFLELHQDGISFKPANVPEEDSCR